MRPVFASLVGLVFAASAPASTLTFVLSMNDNGGGNYATAGAFAVYAYTSAGDNAGLASFTLTVTGQATTFNRSPQATFVADDGIADNKTSGYILLRSSGGSGVAATGSFDTVSGNGIPQYGVGQTAGNVRNNAPAGYTASSTVAQGMFGVANSFVFANSYGDVSPTGGQIPVLLATGTYSGGSWPTLIAGAGNLFTGVGNAAVPPTNAVSLQYRGLIPEPAGLAVIGVASVAAIGRRRKAAVPTV